VSPASKRAKLACNVPHGRSIVPGWASSPAVDTKSERAEPDVGVATTAIERIAAKEHRVSFDATMNIGALGKSYIVSVEITCKVIIGRRKKPRNIKFLREFSCGHAPCDSRIHT
jgi:hypothetical protein